MDLRILLDTSALIEAYRGRERAVMFIERADAVFLPFVVVAELRVGVYRALDPVSRGNRLKAFLEAINGPILWPTEGSLDLWARLDASLTVRGEPIAANDLWIATLAIQHNLTLLTKDKVFLRLPVEVELLPS